MQQPRRTQVERQTHTRRSIIEAAVICIDQLGFHEATMQRVALEAGVTVGAVQHHFPSKSALLGAVLRDGFHRISLILENVDFVHRPLEERISLFVDHCWKHCNSAGYQAILQILLGLRHEIPDFEQWLQQNVGRFVHGSHSLWRRIFGDIGVDEQEHFKVLLFIFSMLSGAAMLSRINQQASRWQTDIVLLKRMLHLHFMALQRRE